MLDGVLRLVYAGNLTNLYEISEGAPSSVGSGYMGVENGFSNSSIWDSVTDTGTTFAATAGGFTDSANAFVSTGVEVGSEITFSGFTDTSINTVYMVDTVVAGTITTTPVPAATEVAGASVTYVATTIWDGGGTIWDGSAGVPTQWSMVNFGTWVLATNGVDTPQIFKGSSFADLTGLPTTLAVNTWEIFAKRGPYVLAFNSDVDSRDFYWCHTDDPEQWEPTTTNAAGDLRIRELKTPIKAAVPLGDRIAVYGDDQMFLVNFVGSPNFFGYQPAINGIGAVSKHAIVPVGRRNFGWSQQGFFVTDGVSFNYIDDPQVRRFIQDNTSITHIGKVNGYHDEQNNQVRWYYPNNDGTEAVAGKCNAGIIYNYKNDTWSLLDVGRSASQERLIYDHAISGGEDYGDANDGLVLLENSGENNNVAALVSYARTKGLDLGSPHMTKELTSIRIGAPETALGLTFRVGWSDTENGTITWGDYKTYATGYDFTNLRTAGRWLFLEFYSSSLNATWEINSLEIVGRMEGTR